MLERDIQAVLTCNLVPDRYLRTAVGPLVHPSIGTFGYFLFFIIVRVSVILDCHP